MDIWGSVQMSNWVGAWSFGGGRAIRRMSWKAGKSAGQGPLLLSLVHDRDG